MCIYTYTVYDVDFKQNIRHSGTGTTGVEGGEKDNNSLKGPARTSLLSRHHGPLVKRTRTRAELMFKHVASEIRLRLGPLAIILLFVCLTPYGENPLFRASVFAFYTNVIQKRVFLSFVFTRLLFVIGVCNLFFFREPPWGEGIAFALLPPKTYGVRNPRRSSRFSSECQTFRDRCNRFNRSGSSEPTIRMN